MSFKHYIQMVELRLCDGYLPRITHAWRDEHISSLFIYHVHNLTERLAQLGIPLDIFRRNRILLARRKNS